MAKNTNTEFDRVYKRSYRKVLNFARKLCNNQEHAEDVAQETFIRAYSAFDRMENPLTIDNWLIKIARNVFLDQKRKEKCRVDTHAETVIGEDDILETVADPRQNIEQLLLRCTYDPEIERTLAALDPASMELIHLAFVECMPHAEIAARLGLRMEKVRSLIQRVCSQLQRSLAMQKVLQTA